MQKQQFYYELPEELIARFPLVKRSASRLLCLNSREASIAHKQFTDIISLISANDLLVCNNSRVIPARLWGQKDTGGRVEVLVERILDDQCILAHVRASKSPKPGSYLQFSQNIRFKMLSRQEDLFELICESEENVLTVIEKIGELPLPPYFERAPEKKDDERYQTIYADPKGSVAAPTAGLHFDEEIMQQLQQKGVEIAYLTLHVGAGTFAPVRVENIREHRMHSEYIEVSESLCEKIRATKARGGRIIAVGTTTARSLETASLSGQIKPFRGETNIFIYPGFQFKCVDALITNFHLPHSTLLMLVSAFAGHEFIMQAYQEAVREKYRFFSYGDAMMIDRLV